ncbi:MAG: fibronectin type III-like domain-contianing protein, partial [Acidobacteriales bacterium]|nr:fibronectin type III-like domain-contianing protein [Terriglobales bacterium]
APDELALQEHPSADENVKAGLKYTVRYDEGLKVGYKWFDAEKKPVLFPFGFGLSYTTYSYSDFRVSEDGRSAELTVANTGRREGAEIAQLYASLPESAGEPPKRLVGWAKVTLAPGESKRVKIEVDPHYLEIFDEGANGWKRVAGSYTFLAGPSSRDLPLRAMVNLR